MSWRPYAATSRLLASKLHPESLKRVWYLDANYPCEKTGTQRRRWWRAQLSLLIIPKAHVVRDKFKFIIKRIGLLDQAEVRRFVFVGLPLVD
jgi:hypothetical protein